MGEIYCSSSTKVVKKWNDRYTSLKSWTTNDLRKSSRSTILVSILFYEIFKALLLTLFMFKFRDKKKFYDDFL